MIKSTGEHIFIEPMEWMQNFEEESGQLRCSGCALTLGNYDWRGSDCSCGARMSPAFRISAGLVLVRERPPSREKKNKRFQTDSEPANSGTPIGVGGQIMANFPSPNGER